MQPGVFHRQQVVTGGNAGAAHVHHVGRHGVAEHRGEFFAQLRCRLETPVAAQVVGEWAVQCAGHVAADPIQQLHIAAITRRGARIERLESALRGLSRPILGRIADKALWLDLRCLEEHDEAAFCAAWEGLRP